MFAARPHHRYTYAEYVALEQQSQIKHEFLNGEIYAMADGTEEHSALAAEILTALGNALAERPCRAHTSGLRIYVEAVGLATSVVPNQTASIPMCASSSARRRSPQRSRA
ncbi:MAG TPA: Uma2 family endonuclease [Polyangiaceae bacterium]